MTGLAARIAALSDLVGPPGREAPVRAQLRAWLPAGAEAREDALGSLLVRFSPRRPSRRVLVLLALDEPAAAVTHLDAHGRAALAPLGALPAALAGRRVVLPSGVRAAVGVRGADPDADGPLDFDRLYLDFGLRRRVEAARVCAVGDAVVPDVRAELLPGGALCGKALGSRAACAAALRACAGGVRDLRADVTLAFVAQAAVGPRGVPAVVAQCPADLILSVGPAAAAEGRRPRGGEVRLGGGAALIVADQGLLASAPALDALGQAAARAGLELQAAVADPGSAAAGAALIAAAGVPAGALAIPLRHPGTACEVCSPEDVAAVAAVLGALLRL